MTVGDIRGSRRSITTVIERPGELCRLDPHGLDTGTTACSRGPFPPCHGRLGAGAAGGVTPERRDDASRLALPRPSDSVRARRCTGHGTRSSRCLCVGHPPLTISSAHSGSRHTSQGFPLHCPGLSTDTAYAVRADHPPVGEVFALDGALRDKGLRIQDSGGGSAADWERASGGGSGVSGKCRSRWAAIGRTARGPGARRRAGLPWLAVGVRCDETSPQRVREAFVARAPSPVFAGRLGATGPRCARVSAGARADGRGSPPRRDPSPIPARTGA